PQAPRSRGPEELAQLALHRPSYGLLDDAEVALEGTLASPPGTSHFLGTTGGAGRHGRGRYAVVVGRGGGDIRAGGPASDHVCQPYGRNHLGCRVTRERARALGPHRLEAPGRPATHHHRSKPLERAVLGP